MKDPLPGTVLLVYQEHKQSLSALAWSHNGKYIASTGYDNKTLVWDASKGSTFFAHPKNPSTAVSGNVYGVCWSPDSSRIVSAYRSGYAEVLDPFRGIAILTYDKENHARMFDVSWSPDGKYIASAYDGGIVKIWNATTGATLLIYRKHATGVASDTAGVYAAAWSPDGRRIASAGREGTVRIWDASTGATIFIYRGHINNKRVIIKNFMRSLGFYRSEPGYRIEFYRALEIAVHAVAWSPDGKRLVTASHDHTAHVLDAATGAPLLVYPTHTKEVVSVSWSPNGKLIASGSFDKTVHVWDASNGKTLLTYLGHSDIIRTVAWSPDGSRIASGSQDTTVQIWQAPSTGVKAPPLIREKPSSTPLDWGDLVSKVFDKIAGVASIIALLDAVERRWRERSTTHDTLPHQAAPPPSETDIVAIRLRMAHGPDHQFEEWLTDLDRLKYYIDAFNQPSSTVLPLKAIFVQRNGKEIPVDVLKGTQNNPQLDELLSYLNINSEQK